MNKRRKLKIPICFDDLYDYRFWKQNTPSGGYRYGKIFYVMNTIEDYQTMRLYLREKYGDAQLF